VHDDESGDGDSDEEPITAEELDFFAGSTTFGCQVAQLGGCNTQRKSM